MSIEQVEKGIYTWGIYPALVILREQQDLENYENCDVLKSCISRFYPSSKVDEESLNEAKENILNRFVRREIIEHNMPYYVDEFKDFLKL